MIPEYGGTTFPEHLRMYDRNFKFPQNSKEEVSIDTASHKTWIDPIRMTTHMSKSETVLMIDPDLHLGTFKLLIACHNIAHRVLVRQSRNRGALFTALELDGIISAFPIERSITIKNYSIRRRQVPIHASDRLQFSEALLDLRSRGTGVSTHSIIGAITSTKKGSIIRY
jgi:hypothetical protein